MTPPRTALAAEEQDALLGLAMELALEAGAMVREGRLRQGISDADTKSSSTDVVTEFDRASERLIVDGILAVRPDDGIIGEEGAARPGRSGIHWLIDPIDGTTNFLYGLAGYAVSIAARASGPDGRADDPSETEIAVVHIPATRELFAAVRGRGAAITDPDGTRPIQCGHTTDLSLALVATGFSYLPARRAAQAERVAAMLPHVRDLRRFGAAAPDLCYAAAGRVDVYFEEFLGPWDLAAGELIAREAGCRTGSLDGGPARPDSVIVANPALFDQALTLVQTSTRRSGTPGSGLAS